MVIILFYEPPSNIVADFCGPSFATKHDSKRFAASVDEVVFDKIIASGLVGMRIDLFAGSFECAVTKDATVELNNFDRAVTMRTAYKNIEHIYLLSKKTNKRGGFGNRSRTLAK